MDQDRRSQWLRGVLDLCVLALLSGGESYGYQLAQALEKAGIGPIQGGTLYPALLRLQRTGLIAAQWRNGESGPARKYYRLTPGGWHALRDNDREWQTFARQVGTLVRGAAETPGPAMASIDGFDPASEPPAVLVEAADPPADPAAIRGGDRPLSAGAGDRADGEVGDP